jgi:hypothetical protein
MQPSELLVRIQAIGRHGCMRWLAALLPTQLCRGTTRVVGSGHKKRKVEKRSLVEN